MLKEIDSTTIVALAMCRFPFSTDKLCLIRSFGSKSQSSSPVCLVWTVPFSSRLASSSTMEKGRRRLGIDTNINNIKFANLK